MLYKLENIDPIFVFALGNPERITTWSGIPRFLIKSLNALGAQATGIRWEHKDLRIRRILWNLRSLIISLGHGGYQYSPDFERHLMKRVKLPDTPLNLLSVFPLFPTWPWKE